MNRQLSNRTETFFSLFLPAGAAGLSTGLLAPVLPELAKSHGVTVGVATWLFTIHMAGSAVGTLPTGYLIDKIGRRRVLLIGPVITAVSTFMIVFATSFPELLIYRFIGGWGQQMWALSRLTVIADAQGDQRGRQVTSMFAAQRIGTLVGPAAGGFIAVTWNLDIPFMIYGIVILAGMIPSYFVIKEMAPQARGRGIGHQEVSATWREMFRPPVPTVFSAQFLVNVARGGVENGSVLLLYAAYQYGTDPAALGLLTSVMAGVSIPIALVAGLAMDRLGRKAAILPGTLALGTSLAFLAFTAAAGLPFGAFIVAFVAIHMSVSMMLGSWQTLATDIAPPFARGRFFGISRTVSHSGRLSSPASFGFLSDVASFGAAFSFLATASIAAAGVVGFLVKETLVKTRPDEQNAPASTTGDDQRST